MRILNLRVHLNQLSLGILRLNQQTIIEALRLFTNKLNRDIFLAFPGLFQSYRINPDLASIIKIFNTAHPHALSIPIKFFHGFIQQLIVDFPVIL